MNNDIKKYRAEALELAIENFELFCKYAGVKSKQLKVCIERSKGRTLGQISLKFNISRDTVKSISDRCFK